MPLPIVYSFRNVPFHPPIGGDGQVHRPSRALAFSREQVPFSAAEVIDLGGTGALTFALTVQVDPAHISDFEVQLGQIGTLVWDTLVVQAVMTKCDGEGMLFDGQLYWVGVEFVEVDGTVS